MIMEIEKMDVAELLKLGKTLREENRIDEAAAVYSQSISLDSSVFWAHYHLANIWLEQAKVNEAIASYQRAIEIDPSFHWSYHHLGNAFAQQQRWQEAAVAFQQAIALHSEHYGTYHGLGQSLQKLGNFDEAIVAFQKGIELNQDSDWLKSDLIGAIEQKLELKNQLLVNTYYSLAQSLVKQGKQEEAISYWLIILQQFSNILEPETLRQVASNIIGEQLVDDDRIKIYSQISNIFVQKGQLEQAITILCSAVLLNSNCQELYHILGEIISQKTGLQSELDQLRMDLDETQTQLLQLQAKLTKSEDIKTALNETQTQLLQLQAELTISKIIAKKSISYYQWAVESHPEELLSKEEWDQATNTLRDAMEIAPESGYNAYVLGLALTRIGQEEEALAVFHRAVELLEQQAKVELAILSYQEMLKLSLNGDIFFKLGMLLAQCGRFAEALTAYEQALQSQSRKPENYAQLAVILVQQGFGEEVINYYHQVFQQKPEGAKHYHNLGIILSQEGRLDDAIEMYRTAIKLNPGFHGFHYHLAQALIGKNDYQNAIAELLLCIDKNFQHYPSYDLIGDLLIEQGQEDKLIQLYKQGLLAMRHSSTDHQKIIQKISDLGLDQEIFLTDTFLNNLQVVSDFWEPHQPVCKRDEWIIIELLFGSNGAAVSMTGWNLVAAKCLQKLYGYRIAAYFVAWGYDDRMKELLISFGVEKFIITNNEYGLTDRQKYQLEKFSQDANSENFKYLLKDFQCDDLHIGDLVYDVLIRLAAPPMSTPILDQGVMAILESQCLAYNFWKNFLDSCKVKFLITSHANVYIQGCISRLVATAKGIVLGAGCQYITRYETVDELYDDHFFISEQLFLYFWNHHRYESAAIGRKLLENTTGITRSNASLVYETKAYKDKKVYTHLEFCEQLNLDPSLPIVIVASHVFNDAPHSQRHRLFVDFYEALVQTLKICSQIDSVNWIVKEHPEVGNISMGYDVDKTAKKLVNNEYNSYQHIKLAPDDLSNLSLIDFCDAVVTVSGTIAHELACFGIPSILAGSSNYSECGFTNNPQSVDEYKSLLYSIDKQDKLSPEKIEKAYVAYAILYHYMSPVQGNLALGWAEPWAAVESLANKIRSNEIGTVEEDPFFKNFMTQIFLKQRHLLRFDELLD